MTPPGPGAGAWCTIEPTIRLSGELDLSTLTALTALRPDGSPPPAAVDLAAVTFLDASTLGWLVRLHEEAERAGRPLRITGVTPRIRRIFEIADLTCLLNPGVSQRRAASLM